MVHPPSPTLYPASSIADEHRRRDQREVEEAFLMLSRPVCVLSALGSSCGRSRPAKFHLKVGNKGLFSVILQAPG